MSEINEDGLTNDMLEQLALWHTERCGAHEGEGEDEDAYLLRMVEAEDGSHDQEILGEVGLPITWGQWSTIRGFLLAEPWARVMPLIMIMFRFAQETFQRDPELLVKLLRGEVAFPADAEEDE